MKIPERFWMWAWLFLAAFSLISFFVGDHDPDLVLFALLQVLLALYARELDKADKDLAILRDSWWD